MGDVPVAIDIIEVRNLHLVIKNSGIKCMCELCTQPYGVRNSRAFSFMRLSAHLEENDFITVPAKITKDLIMCFLQCLVKYVVKQNEVLTLKLQCQKTVLNHFYHCCSTMDILRNASMVEDNIVREKVRQLHMLPDLVVSELLSVEQNHIMRDRVDMVDKCGLLTNLPWFLGFHMGCTLNFEGIVCSENNKSGKRALREDETFIINRNSWP